jgi:hypothetical protein
MRDGTQRLHKARDSTKRALFSGVALKTVCVSFVHSEVTWAFTRGVLNIPVDIYSSWATRQSSHGLKQENPGLAPGTFLKPPIHHPIPRVQWDGIKHPGMEPSSVTPRRLPTPPTHLSLSVCPPNPASLAFSIPPDRFLIRKPAR